MNTNFKYLAFVTAILLSSACAKEMGLQESTGGREITIMAMREGFKPDTKTTLKSDGSVEWCPLDEISVFYKDAEKGGSKFIAQNTEQAPVAVFKGILEGFVAGGEDFTNGKYLYGIYPYSTNTSFSDGVTTIVLPSYQVAAEGTFANGLFPTIARSQGVNLAFYNICGGIKFIVSRPDITSVIFKGNNGERIAGTVNVVFDEYGKPLVKNEEIESKDEIIVFAPSGGSFEVGKEYYIVAYPVKLNSGYSISYRTSGQKEGTYFNDKSVEIKRSVFGVINQADKNIESWTDITSDEGGDGEGIYLGITGFNQQLFSYPLGILNKDTKVGFDSFINDLNMKNGTLLYYSVEQAINKMQSVQLPSSLSTVAIVTFTDGLDQGSIMMNSTYSDNTEYLNALNNKIKTEKIGEQPITAYSIGIKGSDVADVTTFRNNLAKLASSPSNATEVASMSEVNEKFKEIANQLSKSNYIQTINLTMPGVSNGTLVRFTFDNVNSASNSSLYIEGTFNLITRSLENVEYVGLSSKSGTTIKGVVDGIFVTFTFEGVHTDRNILIDSKFIDEWTYITSSSTWQINSEFDKTENSDIVTERSSAVIMLILDCSSSLASDFPKAQTNAKDFINTLYESIGGDSGQDAPDDDNTIYSTTPKDQTLAIWKDGKRYYLTQEEYAKANLSGAVIEGLTIVGGGESFIISLNDVQTDAISNVDVAMNLYDNILPSATQGMIISARWSDIMAAIQSFGGTAFNSSFSFYTSDTYKSSSSYYYCQCICGSGGSLEMSGGAPHVRGARPTSDNSAIYWTDPNDLKLSVLINGTREFLSQQEYEEQKYEISTIEGVAVIAGGEKFVIHLNDAQSSYISDVNTAKLLYGDILPSAPQGIIISAKWSDIMAAIQSFGGTALNSSLIYYTSDTYKSSSYYYQCVHGPGGSLDYGGVPYVRGAINLNSSIINDPTWVDLGLSVKWATFNVGATAPEGYGDYFAWGETEPKSDYSWSTYKYCDGSETTITKYCVTDFKTVLNPEDDAAHVNWDGNWRMPTAAEFEELFNADNCVWTWTTLHFVRGIKVVSKKSGYEGNWIFLPAAGCRFDTGIGDVGSGIYYWSSSLRQDHIPNAYYLETRIMFSNIARNRGQSVRPVCP